MKDLKHIPHGEINLAKWDKTVNNSTFPSIFANSFFLNAMSPGWDALIIGDYETVFPLTWKRKFTYDYLPQPLFAGQLGIFGKITAEIENKIYSYIKSKYKLIEIELNLTHVVKGEEIDFKKTHVIDYKKSWEYNQNSKRNIKKAISLGLSVIKIEAPLLFQLSKKHLEPFLKTELKISNSGLVLFNNLLHEALKQKALVCFCVYDSKERLRALAHFIYHNNHALYLKGTTFDKTENSGSMHLLMDTAIHYFQTKSKIFDFGGGTKEGLANFFTGLGGSALFYPTYSVNKLPGIVKLLKNKSRRLRA